MKKSLDFILYRLKYRYAPYLKLDRPVDISLELASACNQSCSYCLHEDSLILTEDLIWKKLKDVNVGDSLIAFDEYSPGVKNKYRKMRTSIVENKWVTQKYTVKIKTENNEVICSLDHRFLDSVGRWRFAKNLKIGDIISFSSIPWESKNEDMDYIAGYLRGIYEGDGTARWNKINNTSSGRQTWWRVALKDGEPLIDIVKYLSKLDIKSNVRIFSGENGSYKEINKVEIRGKSDLKRLHKFIYNEDLYNKDNFKKGYLSGIFDAEGSFSSDLVLRISQIKDAHEVIRKTSEYLSHFKFDYSIEKAGLRLNGNYWNKIRFLGFIGSKIKRKKLAFVGSGVQHLKEKIVSIEHIGYSNLIDIQTSTKTFYANGYATHNCYHADQKTLPFKKGLMDLKTAQLIIADAECLGVNSLKFNYRGESTLNPHFKEITAFAKELAHGSTFIDRVTNSNFKFLNSRDDIFDGLCNQTKVKVSFDSFQADVMHKQRTGSIHSLALNNIDKFYNYPKRKDTELVIQAVRTKLNKDEDILGLAKKRWPSALVSIRDLVGGRVDSNLEGLENRKRDFSKRQSCIQAHVRLIFDWQGNAQVCCPDIKSDLQVGNIHDKPIFELFNCEQVKQLRKELLNKKAFDKDPCLNCSSYESFKGYKHPWGS